MGKLNHDNMLRRQRISRPLLAVSLAASLAAFGCTTNQNLGNGTPTRSGPEMRTAPTSGVTSGGETTTPVNPPMMSSYSRPEALPSVTRRSLRLTADEAAAIMAAHQAARGRYLGVSSPGAAGRPYESTNISTFVSPAMQANPQRTINASISSPQTAPGITSGTEGLFADGTGAFAGATTTGATVAGDATPTTAAAGIPAGAIAGAGTLPTVASSGSPTVTAASAGAGRATAGRAAATAGTTATTTTPTTAAGARVGSVTAPVRVLRGTNGNVTVTNVNTSTNTGTGTGRNQ